MTPFSPDCASALKEPMATLAHAIDSLSALADAHAHLADIIEDAIHRIQYRFHRTPERDRASVVQAIRSGSHTVQDILDEVRGITDLTNWTVRKILKRLVAEGAVVARRQNRIGSGSGRWATLYFLHEQVSPLRVEVKRRADALYLPAHAPAQK
jgi:predicted transcriptional regulator